MIGRSIRKFFVLFAPCCGNYYLQQTLVWHVTYGPYLFVRMFSMRLSRLRRRRRGRGRPFRRSNHRLRRLQGASRRRDPDENFTPAQGKPAHDRAEIRRGVEPAAASRRAPLAEIQSGLSNLAPASHPSLGTAGKMSEVRNVFRTGRPAIPRLGLSGKYFLTSMVTVR